VTVPEPASRALGWILLIGIAFYSADTTAAVMEDRLRVAPKPIASAPIAPLEAVVPAQAVPPGLVDLLATTEPDIPVQVAEGVPGVSVQPAATAPPANLNLRGTMAGVGGSGLAMIDLNGETVVVSVGEEIGGMTLTEVGPYSAVLEGGGRSQILEMDVATDIPAVTAVPPVAATDDALVPNPSPSPNGDPTTDATPGVGATPAMAGSILSQRELRNILDNPGQFAGKGFRMKPVLREGEIVGMRVTMKDASHPLARLGVQDGDIVRSLNGQELNGPESLSSIYRVLRNTSSLKFDVERNGQNQSIDVSLSE
jgi:type II secretion system protein C